MRYLLVIALLLTGCASHQPRVTHAPAPTVSTEPLRQSIAANAKATASANTRVETVIRTVDRIVKTVDAATAKELAEVRTELFKVQGDLRDAQSAASNSETLRLRADADTVKLRDWGLDQQKAADYNASGWQAEEKAHAATKAKLVTTNKEVHKLKLIIGTAIALLCASLASHLLFLVPPQYRAIGIFALPFVGGLVGFIGSWLLI